MVMRTRSAAEQETRPKRGLQATANTAACQPKATMKRRPIPKAKPATKKQPAGKESANRKTVTNPMHTLTPITPATSTKAAPSSILKAPVSSSLPTNQKKPAQNTTRVRPVPVKSKVGFEDLQQARQQALRDEMMMFQEAHGMASSSRQADEFSTDEENTEDEHVYTSDIEEPNLPPLFQRDSEELEITDAADEYIKAKDRLRAVMEKQRRSPSTHLLQADEGDIQTSDIEKTATELTSWHKRPRLVEVSLPDSEVSANGLLTSSETAPGLTDAVGGWDDYNLQLKIKLRISRTSVVQVPLKDTTRGSFRLLTVGFAFTAQCEKRCKNLQIKYLSITLRIACAKSGRNPRVMTIEDFACEEEEEMVMAELDKFHADFPRLNPCITFEVIADAYSRRNDAESSDPPSSPPLALRQRKRRRDDLPSSPPAIPIKKRSRTDEMKAQARADAYKKAGNFEQLIQSTFKCNDRNCSNFENICFRIGEKHFNVTGPNIQEWTSSCQKGSATPTNPPARLVVYWETVQGAIGRGTLASARKAMNHQILEKVGDIEDGMSRIEAARRENELQQLQYRQFEMERDRKRIEREDRIDERREREREDEQAQRRRKQEAIDEQEAEERRLRRQKIMDREEERMERSEAQRRAYLMLQQPSSVHDRVPASLQFSSLGQTSTEQGAVHRPISPATAPAIANRLSSSPVSQVADDYHLREAFFTHQISKASDEDQRQKWLSINRICKAKDWLLRDMKRMGESDMNQEAIKAGIPHGTAGRMRTEVKQFKSVWRAQEALSQMREG